MKLIDSITWVGFNEYVLLDSAKDAYSVVKKYDSITLFLSGAVWCTLCIYVYLYNVVCGQCGYIFFRDFKVETLLNSL